MPKVSMTYAALLTLALTGPVTAQESVVMVNTVTAIYEPHQSVGQAFLTPAVEWIAKNFDLPANHSHPRVERAPTTKLVGLRTEGRLSQAQLDLAIVDQVVSKRRPIAAYDDASRTIYVPAGWSADTPQGQSVLIHAMVYHLQNLAGRKYECDQERARLAYEAQARWLSFSGRTLETDFGLDPVTQLVSTECHIP